MKKNGPTFYSIRKDKGISQKEVYMGVVSRSFYQKFEKGEYTTSTETFEKLLERINLTYDEFFYIKNDRQLVPYDQYLVTIFEAYQNEDSNILDKIQNQLRFSNLQKEVFLSKIALLLQNNLLNKKMNSSDFDFICIYLNKIQNWTFFEAKLFNNIMSLLPFKERNIYFKKYRSFSRSNADLGIINAEFSNWHSYIYLNHIQLLLFEGNYEEAIITLKEMKNDKERYFTNERNELAFLFLTQLVDLYNQEKRENALNKLNEVLELVYLLNKTNGSFYSRIKQIHEKRSKLYFINY